MLARRFWAWPWELRRAGVLSINARNLRLVHELNPRALYGRLDDKVQTKAICQAQGIPVPETYAVIDRYGDLRRLDDILADRQEFVVKPACGSGGRGVVVILRRDRIGFHASDGEVLSPADMRYYMSGTLSGMHSLGGRADRALVEQRIAIHPVFAGLAVGGTPDIRVLVHRGRAVMAMLRLPTRQSRGRANLHQGAVGVGVDLAAGRTTNAVHDNRAVARHPDSGAAIAGAEIPHWGLCLDIAGRLSRALELGYIGVDVILDARQGPMVLEANARPGLSIQIANSAGLAGLCGGGPPA